MLLRLFFAVIFAICLGGILSMALDPTLSKRNQSAPNLVEYSSLRAP
jgi:hypothetical protein